MPKDCRTEVRLIEDRVFGANYHDLFRIIEKLCQLSPRLSNLELIYCFHMKLESFKIIQNVTLETAEKFYDTYVYEQKKDPEGLKSFLAPKLDNYLKETIAFFEAYLNAFYSFLQILAKMIPYFFDQNVIGKIPDNSFGEQRSYFLEHPKIDPEYYEYIENKTQWYETLKDNRNAVTHNITAYLWFDPVSIFFVSNEGYRRNQPLLIGKKGEFLEAYILDNWTRLLQFLAFFTNHFKNGPFFVDVKREIDELKKYSCSE